MSATGFVLKNGPVTEYPIWMDRRLLEVYHNQFPYKAEPPQTLAEWKERTEFTKAQVRLAAGLDPMPKALPLKPEIWGHVKQQGVVIAKVRFETMPGLFVSGNLYMPERIKIQAPGILSPHGHAASGRVEDGKQGAALRRFIMLARLGFVVFGYDMIGFNDNDQIMHRLSVEMLKEFSLNGVSIFGLQTWNSLRALDFLCSLPEVDERRIGITGESGGASQTWFVSLLDERIKVMAPVCMLSSHYQGGCQCEEGPLLRLNGVTSFDILSACAPRPMLLPAATGDWTNLNPRYEIPALRKVYALFNAEDALKSFQLDAPHNYNLDTRQRVYPWFTHWLLNQSLRESIAEDPLTKPELSDLLFKEPVSNPTELTTRHALEQTAGYLCADALPPVNEIEDIKQFREQRRELVGSIVNNDQEARDVVNRIMFRNWEINDAQVDARIISRRDVGDVIPAFNVVPVNADRTKPVCLLVSGEGKNEFFAGGTMATVMDSFVRCKCHCLAVDIMGSGETQGMPEKSFRDDSDVTFYAFNPTIFSMRVQDILTCLTLLHEEGFEKIALVATGSAVKAAICALAVTKPLFAAVLNMEGQGDSVQDWLQPLNYQPMIFKVGGMKGVVSLANVRRLGVFKPDAELAEYATAFSEKAKVPQALTIGRESFQRLAEHIILN